LARYERKNEGGKKKLTFNLLNRQKLSIRRKGKKKKTKEKLLQKNKQMANRFD
jgi:hypothetical protein